MFKITLSETTENKHQKYFEKIVLPKLISAKNITIVPYDANKASIKYEADNITDMFVNFIDFVVYEEQKSNKFSIGNSIDLRAIKAEIEREFLPLVNLFEQTIVQVNDKKVKIKDYLLEAFGYEQFTKATFYQHLKEAACVKLKKDRYDIAVQVEMVNMLCNAFPEKAEYIRGVLTSDGLNASEFESKLKLLSGIGITIYNFGQLTPDSTAGMWNAYSFVFEGGLCVCPYCNRQYITPVLTPDGMMRADLDHILSKDKHPYLSLSLYNLLPACQQCNQSLKGTRDIEVNPYEESFNSLFNFEMDEHGIIHTKDLGVNPKTQTYLNVFKLELLYNYHKTQGAELAKKRAAYPEAYITELYEKNKAYFKDEMALRELIFGIFTSEEKINEEILSKFRRDIAGQLGIIQKEDSTQLLEKLKAHLIRLEE